MDWELLVFLILKQVGRVEIPDIDMVQYRRGKTHGMYFATHRLEHKNVTVIELVDENQIRPQDTVVREEAVSVTAEKVVPKQLQESETIDAEIIE